MSDEQPVELRWLEVSEPEVVKASIHRFRRRVVILAAWGLLFASAAWAITAATIRNHQGTLEARVARAPAMNALIGDYEVGDIDVGLLKVVRLSGNEIGLQFVFHTADPFAPCCNLFPRQAAPQSTLLDGNTDSTHFGELLVQIPESYVAKDGTLSMLLTNREGGRLGRFTVDLPALHVEGIGGSG